MAASSPATEPGSRVIPVVSRVQSMRDSGMMMEDPISVFTKHTERLGDTFRFYFGGVKEAIVSSNPAVIQHVLKTNSENYHKSEIQMERMGHFLGKGLLTTHGDAWRTQRRLIQRGFHREQLAALATIMHQSLAESLDSFDASIAAGPIDIYPRMMQITFRMVTRSLFSTKFRDEDVDLISATICTIQEFMVRQIVQPYLNPWFALTGELAKHDALRAGGDRVLMEYIQRRRQDPGNHADLLQILMDARYADTGEGMSDSLILSESMQLLVAGHETSSNALSWTLFLLSQHPECTRMIIEELEVVLGDRRLEFADIPKLQYMSQVIDEALRLYPPFWMVDREALEADSAGGFDIPKGSTVIVFIYGVHHCRAYWESPEQFQPARFEPGRKKLHPPFTHIPFGGGPRGCIGGNYAMLQMMMILSEFLRRYDFSLVAGEAVETRPMIILRPRNGIRLHFSPRPNYSPAH